MQEYNLSVIFRIKKYFLMLGSHAVFSMTIFAFSGDSKSSDPIFPTAIITSSNGHTSDFGRGKQYINPMLMSVASLTTMSQAATPWMNPKINIITLSKIPYVTDSKSPIDYTTAGSVFNMTIDTVAGARSFVGNGLTSTPMGKFPLESRTAVYGYYRILPGGTYQGKIVQADGVGIGPYNITSTIPLNPVVTGTYPINSLIVGITLTGAVWHVEYASDASNNWYNPVNALPTDQCFGHPYGDQGQYHLHGLSWKCFPNQGTSGKSPVFGFGLDAFYITGPRAADGRMLTNAELDECHGTISEVTMPNSTLKTTYHYVLNNEYSYSVGCFRGTVNYFKALGSVDM